MDENKNIASTYTNNQSFPNLKAQHESDQISIEKDQHFLFCQTIKQKLERLKLFILSVENKRVKDESLRKLQLDLKLLQGIDQQIVLKQMSDRVQKFIKNKQIKKIKRNWTSIDMKIFIWIVCIYAQEKNIELRQIHLKQDFWKFIASIIPGTTPQSCLFKWLAQKDNKVTEFQWSIQQERLIVYLENLYKDERNKWKLVSQKLFLTITDPLKVFRTPKQCREHYTSFLNPHLVKGPWSEQEDNILLTHTVLNKGQKKWCKLAQALKGRTQNAIKNRYHLIISKLSNVKENKQRNELQMIEDYLVKNDPQFKQRKNFLMELKEIKQSQQKERQQAQNYKKTNRRYKKDKNGDREVKIKKQKKTKVQRLENLSGQYQNTASFNQNLNIFSAVKKQNNQNQKKFVYDPKSFQSLKDLDNNSNYEIIEPSGPFIKEQNVHLNLSSFQNLSDCKYDSNPNYELNWPTLQYMQHQFYAFYNNLCNFQQNMETFEKKYLG